MIQGGSIYEYIVYITGGGSKGRREGGGRREVRGMAGGEKRAEGR